MSELIPVGCYGWYSNRMRGDRKKQEEREKGKKEDENETIEDSKIIDIRNYKPKRIPQLMWRECIKKVWEVDPLVCPKCTGEMRIISFIYKKNSDREDPHSPEYTEPEIVPYDDGWPEHDEPVFDF